MDGFHIRNGVLEEYDGVATDVTVPEEVREIGEEAFWGMDVERVHLPEGLRKIHSDAFVFLKNPFLNSIPATNPIIPKANICHGVHGPWP